MAGIGLYGVYYSKCNISEDGTLLGYNGVQTMGKAIAASFEPADVDDNPLYANNAIAETDAQAAAGGTLTLTLDKLIPSARADLFGLVSKTVTVTVDGTEATGTGFDDTGNETAAAVGVAFISQKQENQNRNIHEAVIYSRVTFNTPSDEYNTLGESVEWQTPELEATVVGGASTGSFPWRKRYIFETQAAAIQFITDFFAAAANPGA